METNTHIEGVTFYNWEFIEEDTTDGVFRKKYLPIGSKKVMIRYINADIETIVNKVLSIYRCLSFSITIFFFLRLNVYFSQSVFPTRMNQSS
jgi:hypothetical protein